MKQQLRHLKYAFRRMAGLQLRLRPQVNLPTVRLGTEYGGWTICPNTLKEQSVVYSFGIGEDISFDLGIIEQYGAQVFAFDPTPKSLKWIEAQSLPANFKWYPHGLAAFDGVATLHPPDNPEYVSCTLLAEVYETGSPVEVEVRRLRTLMEMLGHTRLDILKMDVEGIEYDVIEDLLKSYVPVTQLLVEFHHRFKSVGIRRTRETIGRLESGGYRLFWASANGEQCSFIRA